MLSRYKGRKRSPPTVCIGCKFRQIELARYRLRRAVRNKQKPRRVVHRAGFEFSGLELRLMTLSIKYQEFVRQRVKQPGSLYFDRDVILWHYTNGLGRLGILETHGIFSTQVFCVNDSAECRLWATIALAIMMATLQLPR